MMEETVMIVTRRFDIDEYDTQGLGVDASSLPYNKFALRDNASNLALFSFWLRCLSECPTIENYLKSKKVGDIDYEKYLTFSANVNLENVLDTNLFEYLTSMRSATRKTFNLSILSYLFGLLDDRNNRLRNISSKSELPKDWFYHLLNIVEPVIDGKATNIFIYNHWLDKQGLSPKENKSFLLALRGSVESILMKRDKNQNDSSNKAYKFNWLVHDSDVFIGNYNYDGILFYNGELFRPSENINFHEELRNDDIWSFMHERNTSEYYEKMILDYSQSPIFASEFLKKLAYDREGCQRRIKLLGLSQEDSLSDQALDFIFQNKQFLKPFKTKKINTVSDLFKLFLEE